MPVQSGTLRDRRESPSPVSTCDADSDDDDLIPEFASNSSKRQRGCHSREHDADSSQRKKRRTTNDEDSFAPDWAGATSTDVSASDTDGDVSKSDLEPEPTTKEHTTSPVRNLVPEMLTDVRTIERRDEDHGHSLAHADIQRLIDLLPKASAEVHAVAGELIRSSTARVEDLANGIFQLGNSLLRN